jgi:hypothetical protein
LSDCKHYNTEIEKNEELIKALSNKQNFSEKLKRHIHNLPDLGESNTIIYSKFSSIKTQANSSISQAKDFLKNINNQMIEEPLISADDPAYQHYLNYNTTKQEMKKMMRKMFFRRMVLLFAILCIVLLIAYFVVFKTKGGDHIDLNQSNDNQTMSDNDNSNTINISDTSDISNGNNN